MKATLVLYSDFEFSTRSDTAIAMVGLEDSKPVRANFRMEYSSHKKPHVPAIDVPEVLLNAIAVFKADIDSEEVLNKYKQAVDARKLVQEQEQAERRKRKYSNHYFHGLVLAGKTQGVKVTLRSEQVYVVNSYTEMSAELEYRGVKLTVAEQNDKFYTSDSRLFRSARSWTKPESVISKFVEAAKAYKLQEKLKVEQKSEKTKLHSTVKSKLEELGFEKSDEYTTKPGEYSEKYDGSFEICKDGRNTSISYIHTRKEEVAITVSLKISLEELELVLNALKQEV